MISYLLRLLDDPKPLVVGIGWVVDCVEKRTRVDEASYAINLELVNVAGTTKACNYHLNTVAANSCSHSSAPPVYASKTLIWHYR